jgi:VanZ family protein
MKVKAQNMYQTIKIYAQRYPFSVFVITIVWVLSLAPFFPETPLDDVPFIDKWTHFVMYGAVSLTIWVEYLSQHQTPNYRRLLLWAWMAIIAMSGLLELLQEYATATRNGEWQDLLANAIGATLGTIAGLLISRL